MGEVVQFSPELPEKPPLRQYEYSLLPLLGKTDLLTTRNGRIIVKEKIEVPRDQFGLPLREQFMKDVLATLHAPHFWTGFYDLHHIAWKKGQFQAIRTEEHPNLGSTFRGLPTNLIDMRRQQHEYVHAISLPLQTPELDVTLQVVEEVGQVVRAYDTVCLQSYNDEPLLSEEEKEVKRHQNFLAKLETMKAGWLGIMPDPAELSVMGIAEVRAKLRPIARRKGISNARRSHQAFFRSEAA